MVCDTVTLAKDHTGRTKGRMLTALSSEKEEYAEGRSMPSRSLDEQVHGIDLTSSKTVYTMQNPASVMVVDDRCVGAGMMPRAGTRTRLMQP